MAQRANYEREEDGWTLESALQNMMVDEAGRLGDGND